MCVCVFTPVPHMPTVTKDADSYQATVEVNILDKGYSYVLDEFLDYEGNRALMRVYKAGFKSSYIFSYDTDEIFSIMSKLFSSSKTPNFQVKGNRGWNPRSVT